MRNNENYFNELLAPCISVEAMHTYVLMLHAWLQARGSRLQSKYIATEHDSSHEETRSCQHGHASLYAEGIDSTISL
jgi:hypothetical protein